MVRWDRVEAIFPRMVELRRAFHRHPETAFREVRTARIIMEELDRLAITYDYRGEGSGVIGRIDAPAPARPTIAIRADMDALPVDERTGLPFASEHPGTMHACGHDAHMAMLLGAAALLRADPPGGGVRLIFQPAEETGGGANVVIRAGALEGVDAIFGMHVTQHHAVGEFMVKKGVVTARSDLFSVRVRGVGGHGARPHEAVDAVVIVGMLIVALQTLVSRQADPLYPSVVTIGRVQAGSAANVIADRADMDGTIRTTHPLVREAIHKGLARMIRGMADLHGAEIELEITESYPPVVNTEREVDIARRAATEVAGAAGVSADEHPSMGAEDFAYYLESVPGAYIRIGARQVDAEPLALHSPIFTVDEETLKYGAAFLDAVVRHAIADYATPD